MLASDLPVVPCHLDMIPRLVKQICPASILASSGTLLPYISLVLLLGTSILKSFLQILPLAH